MKGERGAAGIFIVGILAVMLVGGFLLLHRTASEGAATTTAATVASTTASDTSLASEESGLMSIPLSKPPAYSTLTPVDSRVYKSASGVYVKTNDVSADSAAAQFVRLNVPDPLSVVRIYPPAPAPTAPNGAASGGSNSSGSSQPAYYADQQHVYALDTTPSSDTSAAGESLVELAGADPSTFQLLGDQYAKDANNVYLIVTTCDDQGNCSQSLEIIPDADLATFQEYQTSIVDESSGPTIIDASDVNNVYYQGQAVGSASGDVLQTRKVYGTQEPNGLIWVP